MEIHTLYPLFLFQMWRIFIPITHAAVAFINQGKYEIRDKTLSLKD